MMAGGRTSNTAKEMMSRSNRKGNQNATHDPLMRKIVDP